MYSRVHASALDEFRCSWLTSGSEMREIIRDAEKRSR